MISENFKKNWLKILNYNSNVDLIKDARELKESVRIPLTPIEVDAFLLYHLFEILYPRFVSGQQNILDVIVSNFELDNIIFGLYLYETNKPGIHSKVKVVPKDSIAIKQKDLENIETVFKRFQDFILKEHGVKISCIRLIRKRGIDLINSHCDKLNKITLSESLLSILDLIQIFLENDLFSIYPEPIILRFCKNCVSFLGGLKLSKIFTLFSSLISSLNTFVVLNSPNLPFAMVIKKDNKNSMTSEIDIKLLLLDEKYNPNNKTPKAYFQLIQSDFHVDNIVNLNQNSIITFLIELFELYLPPNKEEAKLLFQKFLYGIRSYDLVWSMYPELKINNILFRFLIRLFGINMNLRKLSHWAIPEFLYDLGATYIGLNAKILLILTNNNKNGSKHDLTNYIIFKIQNGSIIEMEFIKNQELISKINLQSLKSVKLTLSEQFGFISHVIMMDMKLIQSFLNSLVFDFHKISIFSLLKLVKIFKNPRYFQLYPEIPPYTLLKKKRSITFLKYLLSVFIDKHEF
ncbi:MAG: hypothetical protein ACFE96_02915 [Candidatus Hermodarchaeota archaeon]